MKSNSTDRMKVLVYALIILTSLQLVSCDRIRRPMASILNEKYVVCLYENMFGATCANDIEVAYYDLSASGRTESTILRCERADSATIAFDGESSLKVIVLFRHGPRWVPLDTILVDLTNPPVDSLLRY